MEHLRRLSALLIAISLALPQYACQNGEVREVHYPLTEPDSVLSIVLISALFTLPLLLLLVRRWRIAALAAGALVSAAGLHLVAWTSTIVGDELLVGWWTYTSGATVYLAVSLWLLWQAVRERRRAPAAPPP